MALKNSAQVSNAGSWKHGSAESLNGLPKRTIRPYVLKTCALFLHSFGRSFMFNGLFKCLLKAT